MGATFVSTGKSALHWAAAVNNVEAAVVLLKNGANKDMQNNKVKKNKSSISSLSTVEKITEHCSAVKYVTCSFLFVCIRRKHLYSWLLGKEVMRLPRSYWTTLLTER